MVIAKVNPGSLSDTNISFGKTFKDVTGALSQAFLPRSASFHVEVILEKKASQDREAPLTLGAAQSSTHAAWYLATCRRSESGWAAPWTPN
jgi:hypothetical protein